MNSPIDQLEAASSLQVAGIEDHIENRWLDNNLLSLQRS